MSKQPKSSGSRPDTVYVTRDARDDALTKRVIGRLPDAHVIEIATSSDPLAPGGIAPAGISDAQRFSLGKRALLLRRHHGNWLEHCPGTKEHVCCNLWTVNPGEGCPYDCTYCYLQSYLLRNPTLKLFTNTADMLEQIRARTQQERERYFRICTGESIDSLVWDELTDATLELVPFFARLENSTLELKTKSANIKNLLALRDEHRGKTVVSWSVNAPEISFSDELYAASLEERIAAAREVVAAGYRVGFHFDPLVYYSGYEDGYRSTIAKVFAAVSPKDIAWVSISTLRYAPEMQRLMIERFPKSKLPFGEQFLAKDNKLRYAQPLRMKLMRFVWDELKRTSAELPVYMCMESAASWREIHGAPPSAGSELVEIFSRRGKR